MGGHNYQAKLAQHYWLPGLLNECPQSPDHTIDKPFTFNSKSMSSDGALLLTKEKWKFVVDNFIFSSTYTASRDPVIITGSTGSYSRWYIDTGVIFSFLFFSQALRFFLKGSFFLLMAFSNGRFNLRCKYGQLCEGIWCITLPQPLVILSRHLYTTWLSKISPLYVHPSHFI